MFDAPVGIVAARLEQAYSCTIEDGIHSCTLSGSNHQPRTFDETLPGTLKTMRENAGFSIDFVRSLGATEASGQAFAA
jgi:hypothetical protein